MKIYTVKSWAEYVKTGDSSNLVEVQLGGTMSGTDYVIAEIGTERLITIK